MADDGKKRLNACFNCSPAVVLGFVSFISIVAAFVDGSISPWVCGGVIILSIFAFIHIFSRNEAVSAGKNVAGISKSDPLKIVSVVLIAILLIVLILQFVANLYTV